MQELYSRVTQTSQGCNRWKVMPKQNSELCNIPYKSLQDHVSGMTTSQTGGKKATLTLERCK